MTLMKPGKASYSSLYLWSRYQGLVSGRLQGHGGKVSECWTAVMLLQRSSEAPAPSLVLSLFILKIPFGVKYILVHFICMSCLFHKLWGPKGGVTSSYLGSFPDPWRHAFKLSRWSNWNSWLLGQWVLYKLTFFFKVFGRPVPWDKCQLCHSIHSVTVSKEFLSCLKAIFIFKMLYFYIILVDYNLVFLRTGTKIH